MAVDMAARRLAWTAEKALGMDYADALREALAALADRDRNNPDDLRSFVAMNMIEEILEQRGCESHDPAADSLTDLISIIIRG